MKELDELLGKIRENSELAEELLKVWKQGAGSEEITAMLASKGIEVSAEQIEEAFAKDQSSAGAEVESQDLDLDQLDRVAGGGAGFCDGAADCDNSFIKRPYLSAEYRCVWFEDCDESFYRECCDKEYYFTSLS